MSQYYNYKTALLIFFMSLIGYLILLIGFYNNDALMGETPQALRYVVLGLSQLLLLLPLFFYVIGNKKSVRHAFRVRPVSGRAFLDILMIAVGMFFLLELTRILGGILFRTELPGPESLKVIYPLNFILIFFISVVITPIVEEAVFRGYLLRVMLRSKYSPLLAVTLSALLFMLAHLDYWNAPGIFLAGLILGFVAYSFYSIIPCIIIHAVFNAMVLIDINLPQIRDSIFYAKSYVAWVIMAGGIFMLLLGLLNVRMKVHVHRKRRTLKEGDAHEEQ
ncbi:MAG: CPBP family intramembrane metalloprotease [FCB group bacterium]|nr:CPBP family intramembrane metalloprotease [FCB group bacterium]